MHARSRHVDTSSVVATMGKQGGKKHAPPQRRPPLPGRFAGATHSIGKNQLAGHTRKAGAAAVPRAKPAAAPSSLLLAGLAAEHDGFAAKLRSLVREALQEAPSGELSLSELGSKVSYLAPRRGMSAELEGKVQSLSKRLKAAFGGWEGFVRDHAAADFVLAGGMLRERPEAAPSEGAAPPPPAERPPPPPVPTAAEVNALGLGLSL